MRNLQSHYREHKETVHNFVWRSLQIFGKQGITFLIFFLCAKFLNTYDFGVYNYILAITFFLIMFGDFGISSATSKYVAEYNLGDKIKLRGILFNSLILIVIFGFFVTLFTLLFGSYFLKEKYTYLLYTLPLFFLAPISSLYDGVFRGLKKFKESAIISLSVGVASIIFVFLLVKNFGLFGALISQSLYYFFLVLVLFLFYGTMHFEFNKNLMGTIFKYSTIIGFGSMGVLFFNSLDTILLGYFGFIVEVSYFQFISKIFTIIVLPLYIFSQVIAPSFVEYRLVKNFKLIKSKIEKYLFLSMILGILVCLLFYFLFPYFIILFFPKYNASEFFHLSFILLPNLFISILVGIITSNIMIATGDQNIIAKYFLLFGIIKTLFSLIIITFFGFIPMIICSVSFLFIVNLLVICHYYLKIRGQIDD